MTGGRVIYLPGLSAQDAPTLEEASSAEADEYHERMQQLRAEEREVRPWRRSPA